MKHHVKRQYGLTLIELMVTIAIIGILVGIAIPSYDYYTRTTKRATAKTALQQVRGLLEQYYTNNKSYTTNFADLGFQNTPLEINKTGAEVAAGSAGIIYEVTINTSNLKYCASCDYEVVATAKNDQTKDKSGDCTVLWFNSLGQKGSANASGTPTSDCW